MKTRILNIVMSVGIIALLLVLFACDSSKKDSKAADMSQIKTVEQDSLVISGIEVDLVKLGNEMMVNNKSYSQAWLIELKIANLPNFYSSGIDFYIDNYKIPEYGGTENGIYFRVFEKDALEQMDKGEIRYKYDFSKDIWSSKQRFNLPNLDSLDMVNEKDRLQRKNR